MTVSLLDVPDVLNLLNYTPTEHVSICERRNGAMFTSHIMATPKATTHGYDEADVWFGVNPIDPTSQGRGTAAQVTRWSALWADLDVKPGGCPDMDTARTITDVVSDMLTSRPVALIYSGHGLQPLWAIDPDDKGTQLGDRTRARVLLRRFGRLVSAVAERYGAGIDSVFDLARVLRAPGTTNYKDRANPRAVLTLPDTGHPITLADLQEALDAYGIPELPEDAEELGEVISPPSDWTWAPHTCGYAATTIRGWTTDTPTARHPWLVSAAVRLAAMHAHGCISESDHQKALTTTVATFRHLLATTSPMRDPTPGEISQALSWGQAKASTMDEARISKELGGHTHDTTSGAAGPFGIVTTDNSTTTDPTPVVTDTTPAKQRHIVLTSAATIKPRPVFWLWKNRLALGTLGLLAGREGTGKSTLSYWITARLTRGELYGHYQGQPKAVLVCATEDSWEHTIVPRLIAAGADLTLVYRVEVVNADDIHVGLSLPRDLLAVERSAEQTGAALLLLDPLMSRLGDLDTHRDAEVRQALEPLVNIADRTSMAILGLIHHNKSGSSDPLQLVMGSKAFTAVARSVHTVVPDPDDDTGQRRLFGTPKNNLGRADLPTFSFTIGGHPVDTDEGTAWTGKLEWGEQQSATIEDAMSQSMDSGDRSAVTEAADWLSDYMETKGGQVASSDAKRAARGAGHAERTLKRACQRLKLEVSSSGYPRATYWELPPQPDPVGLARAGGGPEVGPTGPTDSLGENIYNLYIPLTCSDADQVGPTQQLGQLGQLGQPPPARDPKQCAICNKRPAAKDSTNCKACDLQHNGVLP